MANTLYDKGRERFLTGALDWSTDTIKVILVQTSSGYTFSQSHEFLTDISGGYIVAAAQTLGSKGTTSGAASAANVTFPTVSGATVGAIVIYKDTGSSATSPLLVYIDTATGLPITPNGGDIIVTWDTGTNKIFKL